MEHGPTVHFHATQLRN